MILLQTNDIRNVDAAVCQKQNISSFQLMQRAASAVFAELKRRWQDPSRRYLVWAGAGNNGGDALVVYRLLYDAGYNVRCYLFNPNGRLSEDCERAFAEAPKDRLIPVDERFVMPDMDEKTRVVDGLLGSGLNRPLEGAYAYLVRCINQSGAEVVSIDIPTGLMGENNASNHYDTVLRASLTLTFTSPKLSFLFRENAPYVGTWKVLDIGLDEETAAKVSMSPYRVISGRDAAAILQPRSRFDHKGSNGSACLVAGSRGMMGAALLSARACMRSGVGLLTVCAPACGYDILQLGVPEAKCLCDTRGDFVSSLSFVDTSFSAYAIGPGLGTRSETADALHRFLSEVKRPMVLDADALNLLSAHPEWFSLLHRNVVLTPHPKEADRLIRAALAAGLLRDRSGSFRSPALPDHLSGYARLQWVRALAQELHVVILLKGTYTAVCLPSGEVWFNTEHGNPGMAVGGSGDALTGIILAFLARGYRVQDAACLGVYLHALAADEAWEQGESYESLLPSDLIRSLGAAFRKVRSMKVSDDRFL